MTDQPNAGLRGDFYNEMAQIEMLIGGQRMRLNLWLGGLAQPSGTSAESQVAVRRYILYGMPMDVYDQHFCGRPNYTLMANFFMVLYGH